MPTHYDMHFDSAAELHRIDDVRARFEPAQWSSPAPDAQAELADHREHSVAGQTSVRAIGPVAHGGERDSTDSESGRSMALSTGSGHSFVCLRSAVEPPAAKQRAVSPPANRHRLTVFDAR